LVYYRYEKNIGFEGKIVKIHPFDFDFKQAIKTINEKKYKRILLQIPEGLKNHYSKFVELLEKETNANTIISADPCFGACDIVNSDLKHLKIDFAIQFGHTPFPFVKDYQIPTIFINAKTELDVSEVIEKAIPVLVGKKIGLVSTAQHVHLLEKAKKILQNNNFQPVIGKGDTRIEKKGQIIGCNFSSATNISKKIDMFLYIGDGIFHPLGLKLATKKPVIVCNPYTNEVKQNELDDVKDMIQRQRYGAIARSTDAKTFGIIVGTKIGQQRIDLAYEIKKKLDSAKKKSYIFISNNFNPSYLEGFRNIDCFISTACPRIAIDDYMQYNTPIITPIELDIVLGLKKWDDYQFDEILNE
jgi:2-(3-amino-3-carboxypropyl)histidine synthase